MRLKVKILCNLPSALARYRQLAGKYYTHRIFKAFETFVHLKSLTRSGKLHNVYGSKDAFMRYLAKECFVSRNSIYTRIEWMKSYNLIKVDDLGNILLESWDLIAKTYRVKKGCYQDIDLLPGGPSLEHIIRTLAISEHKKRMEFAFARKINSNNQVKRCIESQLGFIPANTQLLAQEITKRKIASFIRRSENFDFWHSFQSDFNVSAKTLLTYFSFKDFRQVAYWKRKLAGLGLINVKARKFESRTCTRKAHNLLDGGTVQQTFFWNNSTKSRVWILPDAITVNL